MGAGYCVNCSMCVSACSVCHKPVRGLLHWCPLCAHGGHLECNRKWFSLYSTCPAGCGHKCCSSLLSSRQESTSKKSTTSVVGVGGEDYCRESDGGGRGDSRRQNRPRRIRVGRRRGGSQGTTSSLVSVKNEPERWV